MTFIKLLVKDLKIEYEGLFVVGDLHKLIDFWFREKSFDKRETLDIESIQPDGSKHIELELQPWRRWTDYHKQVFRLRIFITDCKNVNVEKDGAKFVMQKGKVTIFFDLFFYTDAFNRSNRPLTSFIHHIWDNIFQRSITQKYEDLSVEDMNHLYQTIKKYFNMQRGSAFSPGFQTKA